jgi:hypothetical protein
MNTDYQEDGLSEEIMQSINVPAEKAQAMVIKLAKMQPQLRLAFGIWLRTRQAPTLDIEGFTFDQLANEYKMSPYGAFLTLDWLLREPQRASHALKQGYDRVVRSD